MRFAFAITALIAAVTAAPSKDLAIVNKRHGMTVHDAAKKCGTGQQLNCCNEQHSNEGDKGQVSKPTGALVTADGLLSHLIGTCGKLDVAGEFQTGTTLAHWKLTTLQLSSVLMISSTRTARARLLAAKTLLLS